jgi:hypothetical protein
MVYSNREVIKSRPEYMRVAAILIVSLASSCLGCGGDRYQLVAEDVAAAGAGGGEGFAETEQIRGNIYRLDKKTGEVILITGQLLVNEAGAAGVATYRVFEPEETVEAMKGAARKQK